MNYILKDIKLEDNLFTENFQIWFKTTMCMKTAQKKSLFVNTWLQFIFLDQYLWIKGHPPK